jgi:hypothetical protein
MLPVQVSSKISIRKYSVKHEVLGSQFTQDVYVLDLPSCLLRSAHAVDDSTCVLCEKSQLI